MRLPFFDYRAPATLDEALSILGEKGPAAAVIGGGTDLVPRLRLRLAKPDTVVSLRNVPGLRDIRVEGISLKIGAGATLKSVMDHPEVAANVPGLADALKTVGAAAIQHHTGTIGGNLLLGTRCVYYNQSDWWRSGRERCYKNGGQTCHAVQDGKECSASSQSDGAPMLAALSAMALVKSKSGERTVPVMELFSGIGDAPFTMASGELLTEIQIVLPPPGTGTAYKKLRWRTSVDFPLISAAVLVAVSKDKVDRVRMVIGGAGPAPVVIDEADRILRDNVPTSDRIDQVAEAAQKQVEGGIVGNTIAPADYRRRMAGVVARRAIMEALERAK